ncbi:hypothetical protein J2T09_005404 [Neorhizobium huautlense]|uniref:Collagen-like protein n=1 Tax=Neorhizobium huautlense TaxID=67774 RepID=A0ABT9Q1M0_9HYPH|nr:hypothetical protein [Neorhizobium huautlense]MDP9840616.1 hypothetical protein [Neorhizobium huautlense]
MEQGVRKPGSASAWPRPKRDRSCDPFALPLPRYSGPQCSGHLEMPQDALAHMDKVVTFLGFDAEKTRWTWIDTARHGKSIRLSWVEDRSYHSPAETWRHLRVRFVYDHIVLREGATLELETPFGDPLEIYVHKLTMMAGARIVINGGATVLSVGQWVGLKEASSQDLPAIELVSAAGRPGHVGSAGADGSAGCRDVPQGDPASGGASGAPGLNGDPLRNCAVSVHTMTGYGRLRIEPGAGGAGAAGQPGGNGGRGGTIAFFKIGPGGNGGDGGDGGDGGRGGDAASVRLDFRRRQQNSDVVFEILAGRGGPGGAAGAAGAGGLGWPDGLDGRHGRPGQQGMEGRPPDIFWVHRWDADETPAVPAPAPLSEAVSI